MPFLLPFIPAILGGTATAATTAALVGGAASIGGALISSNAQKGAADKNLAAQTAAGDKSLAAQEAARQQIIGLEQPFVSGGTAAFDTALQRIMPSSRGAVTYDPSRTYAPNSSNMFGPTATPAPTGAPSPTMVNWGGAPGGSPVRDPGGTGLGSAAPSTTSGASASPSDAGTGAPAAGPTYNVPQGNSLTQPDWNAYGAANPDIAANGWLTEHPPSSVGDLNGDGQLTNADSYAAHYAGNGAQEGRALPTTAAPGTDLMSASRPTAITAPTFGAAPNSTDYFANFQQSPGYAFQRDEALRGANASYAGRGLLKSDSAVKGIMDRASNLANTDYNNWFSQQMQKLNSDRSQYNTDKTTNYDIYNNAQTRQDNNFNTDRGYQTGQFNTGTDNLFKATTVGLTAAGATGSAATTYANNAQNIFGNTANAQGDAANSTAAANAGLAGSVAGTATNIFNGVNYGSGSTPVPQIDPYGYGGNIVTPAPINNPATLTNNVPRIY